MVGACRAQSLSQFCSSYACGDVTSENEMEEPMSRRKGEPTAAQIDRTHPHQVGLPDHKLMGANYDVVHGFCKACPSISERNPSLHRGQSPEAVTSASSVLPRSRMRICLPPSLTAFRSIRNETGGRGSEAVLGYRTQCFLKRGAFTQRAKRRFGPVSVREAL